MDSLEAPFEDETILERIKALKEIFPESLRTACCASISGAKWLVSTTRKVTWIACSTAAILVLPISLEQERLEYQTQMKEKERNIILGQE